MKAEFDMTKKFKKGEERVILKYKILGDLYSFAVKVNLNLILS